LILIVAAMLASRDAVDDLSSDGGISGLSLSNIIFWI
jgi:hypothetical protein